MTPENVSRVGSSRTVTVLAVAALLFGSLVVTQTVSAGSPVTLSSDKTSATVLENENVVFTLTLANAASSDFSWQTSKLYGSWLSGTEWMYLFFDEEGETLDDNILDIEQGESATVLLTVYCVSPCSGGSSNTLAVYAKTDPRYINAPQDVDGDPANSDNSTNTVELEITAVSPYKVDLVIESASTDGGNEVIQGVTTTWRYTVTNTGWQQDTYDLSISTTGSGWTLSDGLPADQTIQGQSNTVAEHTVNGQMSITPYSSEVPDTYTVTLSVTSSSGASDTESITVVVPEPDFEIKDTDISFSHTSAWITARGDSQLITVYAKVRNNGGNIDVAGNSASTVDVLFTVDGATVDVKYLDTLNHGSEQTVSASFKPSRAHSDTESGLPIEVRVDQFNNLDGREASDKAILESDETNNKGTAHFKVVRTKASNPSFYLSFTALTAAVGAAVVLSRYYYRSEDEE
ncbi:MAG: hypothetical protein QF392_01590 [Candidatus Poseidoniia archaeon]|nr:hypothetical protein [Candidatus Poseidoniia archaeon]